MSPFKIISWSIVIAFVVVLVITIAGMIGIVQFKHEEHLTKLVVLLIFEIVGLGFLIYKEGKEGHVQYLRDARAGYDLAQSFVSKSRYDEALDQLSGILRLNRNESIFHIKDVFLLRGNILFNRQAYADSIIPYSVYNEIVNDDAQALARYGRALRHVHRYEEAKQVYEKALALAPNDYYVLNGLQNCIRRQAGFFLEAERREAATQYFEEARQHIVSMLNLAKTASEKREQKILNAELALARLNWQWERYGEAIALFEEIVQKNPNHSAGYEDLAAIYLEYGQEISDQSLVEKSVTLYKEVFDLSLTDQDRAYIGSGLAQAVAQLDNPDEELIVSAKNAVLLSIAKSENILDDPVPFYAAAILFRKMGNETLAIKYINEAIFYEKKKI